MSLYAQHLQALTAPDLTKTFEDQAVSLGTELQILGHHLKDSRFIGKAPEISPGIAAGVTELGRSMIRAKAEHDAAHVAKAANSNIVATLHLMAGSLGETEKSGLRGTVREHWLGRLGEKKGEFKKQTDAAGKRHVATEFVAQMAERDAQDAALASMRRSLLSLADLHQALANGESLTALQLAQEISDEVKATRDIFSQFKAKLQP